MATLDWIVLIGCLTGIAYCWQTLPDKLILTREEWEQLPEGSDSNEGDRREVVFKKVS